MRNSLVRLPLLGMAVVVGGAMFAPRVTGQVLETTRWHTTYAEALKQAKITGKPMLLEFR